MKIVRAGFVLLVMICAALSGCGGGYGGGGNGGGYGGDPAATVTLTVAPTTVVQGQSATLTWTGTGGACTASGAWTGAQPANGSLVVTPAAVGNSTFTLTCTGGGYTAGSASAVLAVSIASDFAKSNLVSTDGSIAGTRIDPQLLNPWGLAFSAGSPIWTVNNTSNTATIYDGTGVIQTLIVDIIAGTEGNADPTGIVFNDTPADFPVTIAPRTAGAAFIFAGENGLISAWSPTVDGTHGINTVNEVGAVFKGLAIAKRNGVNHLYATDFHNNRVVVFDRAFTKVTVPGGFADANLPAGYAPFGIRGLQIDGEARIVVTYARQDVAALNEVFGEGLGIVNIFDTEGALVRRLVPAGAGLNAPWGVALAPNTWGTMSNKLLIGSVGSGVISAYDPLTGARFGTVNDAADAPIVTPNLHGIAFGNGARNASRDALYFFASLTAQTGGLFGRIDLGATPPDVIAPTIAITSPAEGAAVTGAVPITVNAADNVGVTVVEFLVGGVSIGTSTTAPFTFNWNTANAANGARAVTARALDAAGNAAVSVAINATVNNVAVLFTDLYAQIFAAGPAGRCANCHSGGGANLPASMNFSTRDTAYAALFEVTSVQRPELKRVKASDPANSYLVKKIEGVDIGATNRMPLGAAALSQNAIDSVKAWISQGALNN